MSLVSSVHIRVTGQVQGLGFRPYVYRIAQRLKLAGIVKNSRQGVEIVVQGKNAEQLVKLLRKAPPRLARITDISVRRYKARSYNGFSIIASDAVRTEGNVSETSKARAVRNRSATLEILPDLAVCAECCAEITMPDNRRHHYAFTNCTLCGPRYTIIKGIPYDRVRTSMASFRMCPDCRKEYEDPANRRFHAQPNCCPNCGPKLSLLRANGDLFDDVAPLTTAIRLLLSGKILAIKSLGGFHLACDATNESAVAELRRRKARREKPFALMCRAVSVVRRFCLLDRASQNLLEDTARPVVLLPKRDNALLKIAESVAPGVAYWGVMLAYTPLHHLLFGVAGGLSEHTAALSDQRLLDEPARPSVPAGTDRLTALVMTSANRRDEPVITEPAELIVSLAGTADYILTNDRPIVNRCDDSVVFACPEYKTARIFVRRSKGYVPSPIVLRYQGRGLKPVLGCGGELKNTFALGAGDRVYVGPHIGDLSSAPAMDFFTQSLNEYQRWYGIRYEVVACDLHPDMMATRFAEDAAAKQNRRLVRVQHHHAHIASVMAEHNLAEPVLGVALDGTGLGDDGRIWGCELLLTWRRRFDRVGHLRYLPLIGGEAAVLEPLRTAASYLTYLFGSQSLSRVSGLAQYRNLAIQLQTGANVVFTSSTGRLFDAVSGLLGLCVHASYDGQAPSLLESAADRSEKGSYLARNRVLPACDSQGCLILDPEPWLGAVLGDVERNVPVALISRRFHNTFVQALVDACYALGRAHKVKTICLSGGSFQNRLLLCGLTRLLVKQGFKVFTNHQVPVNDGGLSFGQVIVADAVVRRRQK